MPDDQNNSNDTRKYKVLGLHGIAALRYRLGSAFEFDFIDGSFPWPAYPGIGEVFGNDQIYFSYHDGSAQAAHQAVQDLAEYVTDNGPFDAVLAFSSGASLAATLLLGEALETDSVETKQPPPPSFRSAIFLSATLPYDLSELRQGRIHFLDSQEEKQKLQVPTVHSWGNNDEEFRHESEQLYGMCVDCWRSEVRHDAGHGVPTQGQALERLADAILAAVSREPAV